MNSTLQGWHAQPISPLQIKAESLLDKDGKVWCCEGWLTGKDVEEHRQSHEAQAVCVEHFEDLRHDLRGHFKDE